MEVRRIKLILIIGFLAFCSHAQITKTEEVKTNFDREIAHTKELFSVELAANQKAMELQAKEYERRLELLNGEAESLRKMQATYVPRESFEAFQKQVGEMDVSQNIKITDLEKWKSTVIGQFAILQIAFFIILALLNHFKPFAKKETKPTT